jgi:hypothetical protein
VSELPYIDKHAVAIDASPEAVWDAIANVVPRLGGRFGPAFARLLGAAEAERPGSADGLPPGDRPYRAEHGRPSSVP